ncbi:MAG: GTP-dependent dephospho-CoA kinase family protein [Promethearchaeota archaeon]
MKFNENKRYIVPFFLRKELAKPFGKLFEGTIEQNIKIVPKWLEDNLKLINPDYFIICVGDVVSKSFINSSSTNNRLKMCIIDGKTKREKYKFNINEILPFKETIINPKGEIRGNAVIKLEKLLQSDKKYLVIVEGEEDLLVLPIIELIDENNVIIYGQPPITDAEINIPAGMVVVIVSSEIKQKARSIFSQFEVYPASVEK